jgi:hypothetical protein
MMMLSLWNFAALSAGIYCIARSISDLRQRRYVWGIFGLVSAVIFLLTPIQTHAVKVDLLASSP